MKTEKWFQSIREGKKEAFLKYLDEGGDINATDENDHASALHVAVFYEKWEMVGILLERGINPNIQDNRERIAFFNLLYETVIEDEVFIKIGDLLLSHGCNPNLRDETDYSVISLAIEFERDGVLLLFKKYEHLLDQENKQLLNEKTA